MDQLLGVLDTQARRTTAAPGNGAHEPGRLLRDDDGLEFPQEILGLLKEQTQSRGGRQIDASLDHAHGHGWGPRVVIVFDADFNDETHFELP